MYRLCHTYEWLKDMFIYSKIYATLHVIWSFFTVAYHPSWLCNLFRTTLFPLLTHYICAFLFYRAHLHSVISGLMWLITNNASKCYVAYFIKGENFDTWRNTLTDKQLLVKRQIWNLFEIWIDRFTSVMIAADPVCSVNYGAVVMCSVVGICQWIEFIMLPINRGIEV